MIKSVFIALLTVPALAWGAEVDMGVALESGFDLPDPSAGDHTGFGLIPSLSLPVSIALNDGFAIRLNPRLTFATGTDRIHWDVPIDGEPVLFFADDQKAFLTAASLLVGPEGRVAISDTLLFRLGVGIGPSWVGTFHSLTENAQVVFDPDQNDLMNTANIDPYTSQFVVSTDLYTGVSFAMSEGLSLSFELGYSPTYVGEAVLKKGLAELNPRRAAYGWNPLRAGVGIQFSL